MRLYAIVRTDIGGGAEIVAYAATEKMAKDLRGLWRSGEVSKYDILVLDLPTLEDYKEGLVGSIVEPTREPEGEPYGHKGVATADRSDTPVIESPDAGEREADAAPNP